MSIIVKSDKQIEGIRRSCQLAADTLDHVGPLVKAGVTTEDIDREAEAFIRKHGAVPAPLGYMGYPKATCTSLNEVVCHGIPSAARVLRDGDILNVDVTTILDGYFGDTSRMFAVGEVSDEAAKLLAVALDCLNVGIAQVKPGAEFWRIGKAIEEYATSRGYSVVHQFAGHGTGLKFHEEPVVSHNYDPREIRRMRPNMVFTVEPMINAGKAEAKVLADRWTAVTVDGSLSAQWEHTVRVTEAGVEVLTNPTREP